jgi:hypothetical protein
MGKRSITRHHRTTRSSGGDNSDRNISYVQEQHHRAWHLLFKDASPEEIAQQLRDVWLPDTYEVIIRRKVP